MFYQARPLCKASGRMSGACIDQHTEDSRPGCLGKQASRLFSQASSFLDYLTPRIVLDSQNTRTTGLITKMGQEHGIRFPLAEEQDGLGLRHG